MDIPMIATENCNKSPDSSTNVDSSSFSNCDAEGAPEQMVNDVIVKEVPTLDLPLERDHEIVSNKAVVIEQQILETPLQKENSNKSELIFSSNDVLNDAPIEGTSNMRVEPQHIENNVETLNEKSPNHKLTTDVHIHTSALEYSAGETTPNLPLESDHEIVSNKAVVIEQKILVTPLQKENSNESELKVSSNDVNGEPIGEQIIEGSSNMQVEEQHIESNVETLNDETPTHKLTTDIHMHSSAAENTAGDTTTTDVQSDAFPKAMPSAVKSEMEQDCKQSSSLALLAQYDTDDESDDDVREVPLAQSYQNRCVEIDSDSSTSEVEFLSEVRNSINLDRINVDIEGEDDDEEEDGNIRNKRQPKVKGELDLEDLPPIEDLHITVPEEECIELGKIQSIVDQLVLVNALPGTVPLDLETVLFRDKGNSVLGEVFDVLGQVSDPLYCVRFNSNKEINEKGIEVGQIVYVAPRTEHTQFVVLANLMKVRGSDASWENDVEPPPRFIDYSDDEEERSARRPNRKRQSSGSVTYAGRGSYTPRRPYRGNYSGRGGVRQPEPQGNYNIVGNSWHSNYYQAPTLNQPQYRMPGNFPGGYSMPTHNTAPYQQHTPMNPGLVINPYAVYPPPQPMQQSFFPPPHHHQPPPQ
ncbi:H/ACA ribonucleoprotein complex non-core subunit NAF1 [Eupeodes corollae]|uniref:H/ACA ribonucleoprotein complex non-core subunit NAF1 n=1 Tax=Eupeodes corollae TaxID=290404 RepID=UPI002490248C|nr:H/ACA ribonucleoprotein complex non-core subunit NAF1 [Eupeodes corollae]